MRRFWQSLIRRLHAPARQRALAPPAHARPALEALEERWQPTTLTPNQPFWQPPPTALLQPPQFVIATPSPMTLVGKTVELSILEDFQITAMQQEANRSFSFSGTFDGHTVSGTISTSRFGGPLLTTAGISFWGNWYDNAGLQHRIEYNGTLNMNWVQATTWGTVKHASENTGLALLIEGPWHNDPPRMVSGTFV